jgi:hypothetical protein
MQVWFILTYTILVFLLSQRPHVPNEEEIEEAAAHFIEEKSEPLVLKREKGSLLFKARAPPSELSCVGSMTFRPQARPEFSGEDVDRLISRINYFEVVPTVQHIRVLLGISVASGTHIQHVSLNLCHEGVAKRHEVRYCPDTSILAFLMLREVELCEPDIDGQLPIWVRAVVDIYTLK